MAARRPEDARACAVESEQLLRGIGEQVLKFELLKVVAGLAGSRGEHALAARFWGAGQPRYYDAGYETRGLDEAQMAQRMAEARARWATPPSKRPKRPGARLIWIRRC